MKRTSKVAHAVFSVLMGLTLIVSTVQPGSVLASASPLQGNGIRRSVHPQAAPGVPASIAVYGGSPQSAIIKMPFGQSFFALVLDDSGNPVSGVQVTFTAPLTGASGSFSDTLTNATTALTDTTGLVMASEFTANDVDGTYEVVASVGGVAKTANFQATNLLVNCYTIPAPSYQDYDLYFRYLSYFCNNGTIGMHGIGSGDFNQDGRKDIAVLGSDDYNSSMSMLLIFHQEVDHTLAQPEFYFAGLHLNGSADELAVGDVNNDGLDDVVINQSIEQAIGVFYQQPGGSFSDRVLYSGAESADALAIGDINNDGLNDVVFSNWGPSIGVFTQKGDGTLNSVVVYPADPASGGYEDIGIGDVNGDGRNDVVRLDGQGYRYFLVYAQKPDGTLDDYIIYNFDSVSSGWTGGGLGVGDVTGDGRSDIILSVLANWPNSKIIVYPQGQDGSLQSPVVYRVSEVPTSIELVDVNLDGKLDVVTAHTGWFCLGIMLQRWNGTLDPELCYTSLYQSGSRPSILSSGDINGDGYPDLFFTNYQGFYVYYHKYQVFIPLLVK